MEIINVTDEIIEINVTEEVINIQAPTGAYPFPNAVNSVFGRVGNVVGQAGDYTTSLVGEGTNLYYTNARSRAAISETITGINYDSASGIFSLASGYVIPTEASLDAKVPYTGATGDVNLNNHKLLTAQVKATSSAGLSINSNGGTQIANLGAGGGANMTLYGGLSGTSASFSSSVTGNTIVKSGGTSVQFLKADGSVDSTTYTSQSRTISTTAPLTGGGDLSADRTLSMPAATTSANGYLTSTDWNTFNNKQPLITAGTTAQYYRGDKTFQTLDTAAVPENTNLYYTATRFNTAFSGKTTTDLSEGTNLYYTDARARAAITLTTTGTSGAATYSGGTLNIPQYQAVLTNPVTGTGTTNTLPKFTGASTIGNSNITDTGSLITLGSNSFVNGLFGVGSSPVGSSSNFYVSNNITGGTSWNTIYLLTNVLSDVTSQARGFVSNIGTQAATFTLNNLTHYRSEQGTFRAGSTVTTQVGYLASSSLIGATNNYAFQGSIPSGTNRWNLYMDGTAANYLAGVLNIGTTTLAGYALDVNGTARVNGQLTANSFVPTSSTIPTNGMYLSGTNTLGFATNSTLDMTLDANGALGIGTTSLTNGILRIGRNITGSTSFNAVDVFSTVQSDVITSYSYRSVPATQAATFSTDLIGFFASQGTTGAGSTITSHTGVFINNLNAGSVYGVRVLSNNIGSSTAQAFRGDLAAGTNVWNLFMNGTANNYLAGSLGIGTTSLTGINFYINKNITGSTNGGNLYSTGTIQSDMTGNVIMVYSGAAVAASAFTIGNLWHFNADQLSIGAGAAITTQVGFRANNTLVGAGTNYGFQGRIPAQANAWNLYMDGTANNYMAGSLGIGSTTLTGYNLRIQKTLTGATNSRNIWIDAPIASDVTSVAAMFGTSPTTQAASFTLSTLIHYYANQSTLGAGSSVTNQYGFWADSGIIGATNNYGFYGNIPSGTNRWNLYMAGTAANYIAGQLSIGTTSVLADYPLNVQGTVNGNLLMRFANTSNGTSARMGLILGTDFGTLGSIDAYSTTYNLGSADDIANGIRLFASGAGGLSLRASNASATIRIYTGSTERVRVKSQGQMRFVPLASDPSGAEAGDVYYNSTTNKLKVYNGTAWETITSS